MGASNSTFIALGSLISDLQETKSRHAANAKSETMCFIKLLIYKNTNKRFFKDRTLCIVNESSTQLKETDEKLSINLR
jgi:hypothetical protein